MRCKAKNKQGDQCGAWAIHGSGYCFIHDPNQKEARALAVRKGGQAIKKIKINLAPVEFSGGVTDIVNLLAETINAVREGKMNTRKANTIGYLANFLLKALESGDLEERLEKIERVVLERRTYHR